MAGADWADYLAVQRRRAARFAASVGGDVVDEVGIAGWATSPPRPPSGRLFVHDGADAERLAQLLDDRSPLQVSVLDDPGDRLGDCVRLLGGREDLLARREATTAMVLRAPGRVPLPPLDSALTVRPVSSGPSEPDAVSLEAAADACRRADPGVRTNFDPPAWLRHLRGIPAAVLLAAVDEDGEVVATAGASVLGTDANVFFVSTDPDWRGRGVATAMTARALHAAAARGATLACLDASELGRGTYLRLGFQEAGPVRSWHRRPHLQETLVH